MNRQYKDNLKKANIIFRKHFLEIENNVEIIVYIVYCRVLVTGQVAFSSRGASVKMSGKRSSAIVGTAGEVSRL